jgi:hypothetical protein
MLLIDALINSADSLSHKGADVTPHQDADSQVTYGHSLKICIWLMLFLHDENNMGQILSSNIL